jgi:glutamyl-tRNA synthetase
LPPLPYTAETWGTWTAAVKDATGRKGRSLFMPLRKALTGQAHGPDMSQLMPLLQNPPRRD